MNQDSRQPAQNDALRGASLAFRRPPIKPKPQINKNYSGTNGALAAATKAGGGLETPPTNTPMSRWELEEQRLAQHRTGGSINSGFVGDLDRIQQKLGQLDRGGNGFLRPPGPDKVQSPSFIAATLAASRSASVTPNHTGQQQSPAASLQKQSSFTRRSPGRAPGSVRSLSSRGSVDQLLDTSSIPPTTSLIGMFEQNAALQTVKTLDLRRPAASATVRPTPSSVLTPARARSPSPLVIKSSKPSLKSPKPSLNRQISSKPMQFEPSRSPLPARKLSSPASKPIPIPSNSRPPQAKDEDDASSDNSFVSASDYKPSWRAALQNQNRRLTSPSVHSVNTIDSLANAIVASSIASSRAASPSKSLFPTTLYPPPPPRRSSHKHLFHASKEISRTPSPAKQNMLRATMRKPKPDEEVDEGDVRRKKRAHLMMKHPNKHHEGNRKRWRDEITERERKRYEAVWASNKGLFVPPGRENSVCSLVVRDIFSRSRLHTESLEEVYALVDRNGNGFLEREEFVVGLWLIDQRLKGRKLPLKVGDSVWKSAGVSGGIKVRVAGK